MDEPAGDHLLRQRLRQGRAVAEDDAQQQRRLRFGQRPVDRVDQRMTYGIEECVERIARMRGDSNQPGGGHHAGDALLGEVGAVIELVEAGRRQDLPTEHNQIAVMHGCRTVSRRQDAQATGRLVQASEHVVKLHG